MDVGVLVVGDLDAPTGGNLYDRLLVDHLRAADEDVTVLSLPQRSYPTQLLDNVSRPLRRRLNREDFDVLVEDWLCHPSLVTINRTLPYPTVGIAHLLFSTGPTPPFRRPIYRAVERRYCAGLDGIVCNSATTDREIDRLLGERSNGRTARRVIARPGSDRFDPSPTSTTIRERAHSDPLRLCYLGSVVPRKGLDVLIDGLVKLPENDWTLTVVGRTDADPAYANRLRNRTRRKGLPIEFAGVLADEDVSAVFAESHLLAVPSRYESYGIVYPEAMGFGVVPLATTAGAPPEVIGDAGLLVPPDDPDAIAEAIAPLLSDHERRASLGIAARERYLELPTWAETTETVHEFLRALVDR